MLMFVVVFVLYVCVFVFFFKQKTAYEMCIIDWSSDVCSSDLPLLSRFCFFLRFTGCDLCLLRFWIALVSFHDTVGLALARGFHVLLFDERSEESSVGKSCVSTSRSRWSTYH